MEKSSTRAVNTINTLDPIDATWSYLKRFEDESFSARIIGTNPELDLSNASLKKNVGKQAKQIAYSIKQAEEYFKAAVVVSEVTKPVMLYYSAVSLASALRLLKMDGEHSIDYLRKTKRHQHHGLDISKEFETIKENEDSLGNILRKINSKIHLDPQTNKPYGAFIPFYQCINSDLITISGTKRYENSNLIGRGTFSWPSIDKPDIENIISRKFDLLSSFLNLPDLFNFLEYLELTPNICRGEISSETLFKTGIRINKIISRNVVDTLTIFAYSLKEIQFEKLQELYVSKIPGIKINRLEDNTLQGVLKNEYQEKVSIHREYLPDVFDDIAGSHYLVLEPDQAIPEIVNYFISLYSLGMLCRYFPDVWIKLLNSNKTFSMLITEFLKIAIRKFPNLILNQMLDAKYLFR